MAVSAPEDSVHSLYPYSSSYILSGLALEEVLAVSFMTGHL